MKNDMPTNGQPRRNGIARNIYNQTEPGKNRKSEQTDY